MKCGEKMEQLLKVKVANITDIEELAKLRILQQKDEWQNEYEDEMNLYEKTKEYLNKHLNKDIYFFITKNNDKIIATCGIQIIQYLPQCNDNGLMGYICDVFTLPEHRKKGIQTKMLKECIEFAKKKEVKMIQLSTDNPDAISIYKKIGFEYDKLMMIWKEGK